MFDRSIWRVMLLVSVVALPGASTAAEETFAYPGFYLGLAGNTAFATRAESDLEDATGLPIGVDPSLGLHARAGYRLNPHLATEVHYEWLSGFDVSTGGVNALEIEGHTLTADFKGYLLTDRFQPFGLLGLGTTIGELRDTVGAGLSTTEAAFVTRFGGGLDTYLTENLGLTFDVSYVLPTGDLEDLDYVSLGWGLQYRFRGPQLMGR